MSQTCSVISAWIILTRMNTKSYLSSIYTQSSMWTRQGCLLASVVVIHVRTAVRAGEGIHPAPRSPSFGNCASGSSESVPNRAAAASKVHTDPTDPAGQQWGRGNLRSATLASKNLGWGQHCPGWLRAGNETPPSHTLPRPEMKEHCTECYWFTASLTSSHEYQWEFYSWLQRECDWAQHTIQLSNLSKWENNFITRHSTGLAAEPAHRLLSHTGVAAKPQTLQQWPHKSVKKTKQHHKTNKKERRESKWC